MQLEASINASSNNHVDKKTKGFHLKEGKNIFILPNEYCRSVKRETVSMVHATLNTIQYMLEQNKKYDYVCLLSGQDFPIKPKEYINNYLSANHGCNFIDTKYTRFSKRISIFYYERRFNHDRNATQTFRYALLVS